MEARLDEARERYRANPDSAEAAIWVGRRLAYPGRFREAIDFYTAGYYRLLLMYKGSVSPEALRDEALKKSSSAGSHSILYGVGNWYLYNHRQNEATKIFQQMLSGNQWTSFGYIAAETDMKRRR